MNGNNQPTKQDRYEIRKQERMKISAAAKRGRSAKRIIMWITVLAAIGGSIFGLIMIVKNSETLNQYGNLSVLVSENDWSRGPTDAKIVLVEYSDFQCPACKSYFPILKQLNEEFAGQVKFVYRHFPLSQIHANARLAAYGAEAAGKQNKFWEMHDLIFENQEEWAAKSAGDATSDFISFAESLGLNKEQFTSDMDSEEIKDKVSANYNGGIEAGVNSTPTFFLNGKLMPNPRTYDEFRKIISDAADAGS